MRFLVFQDFHHLSQVPGMTLAVVNLAAVTYLLLLKLIVTKFNIKILSFLSDSNRNLNTRNSEVQIRNQKKIILAMGMLCVVGV